jgi:hypothetical protein
MFVKHALTIPSKFDDSTAPSTTASSLSLLSLLLVLLLLLLFPRDHRGALGQFFEINFERDRFICRRQRRRRRRRNILLVFSRRRRRNRKRRLVAHFYSVDF